MEIVKVLQARRGFLQVEMSDGTVISRTGGTVSWRCNNPGNIKHGKFASGCGSIGKDHIGHAVFPTLDHGKNAQYMLLFSEQSRYYSMQVDDAIYRYAPESDGNDPEVYINFITRNIGINRNATLSQLTEDQRNDMIDIMTKFEGYKVGKDIVEE